MGEVYLAYDEQLGREVALKMLPQGLLADDAARRRFRREALSLSKVNHPHIATLFDFAHEQGSDLLVMEYLPGVTLAKRIGQGAVPEAQQHNLPFSLCLPWKRRITTTSFTAI